jgi:hypothetical protein
MGSNGDFYFPAAPMCIGAFSRFRQAQRSFLSFSGHTPPSGSTHEGLKGKGASSSDGFFPTSGSDSDAFLFQMDTQLLDVTRQDRQGDIAFKAIDALIGTAV